MIGGVPLKKIILIVFITIFVIGIAVIIPTYFYLSKSTKEDLSSIPPPSSDIPSILKA